MSDSTSAAVTATTPVVAERRKWLSTLRLRRHGWIFHFLALILVLFWAGLRFGGVALTLGNVLSWVIVSCAVIILVIEFNRSGDVSLAAFTRDLTLAIVALVLQTVLATLIWERQTFYVADLFPCALVLADAWLSTRNSYRTALRNVSAGVNTAEPTQAE